METIPDARPGRRGRDGEGEGGRARADIVHSPSHLARTLVVAAASYPAGAPSPSTLSGLAGEAHNLAVWPRTLLVARCSCPSTLACSATPHLLQSLALLANPVFRRRHSVRPDMQQDPDIYHPSLSVAHAYSNPLSPSVYPDSLHNAVMASASTSNAMDVNMAVTSAGSTPAGPTTPSSAGTLGAAAPAGRRKLSGRYALADFTIERTLGTGSFGRVHLARSRHNMRFYAVKASRHGGANG